MGLTLVPTTPAELLAAFDFGVRKIIYLVVSIDGAFAR
jgi:hypothetical protein